MPIHNQYLMLEPELANEITLSTKTVISQPAIYNSKDSGRETLREWDHVKKSIVAINS